MNQQTLAIATVPMQEADPASFKDTKQALFEGTIFPELTKPFFSTESLKSECTVCNSNNPEEKLLGEIMQEGFFLDDLTLYMDTHPCDKTLIDIFVTHLNKKEELSKKFAEQFYPLTRHFIPYAKDHDSCFTWKKGPAPWEGVWC